MRAMITKHTKRKKKIDKSQRKSNMELNSLIELKFQTFIKKEKEENEKMLKHFQELQHSDKECKKSIFGVVESIESRKISSSSSV